MSRVGLNPTRKTDEDGDDGDGYNDKDEMNRHMKMQVKMKPQAIRVGLNPTPER